MAFSDFIAGPQLRHQSMNVALAFAMLLGIARGGQIDQESVSASYASENTPIDMKAVFTDIDSHAASNKGKPTLLRLVSQPTPPEIPSSSLESQTPTKPIYRMQDPGFQQAEGNALAGPSATRGTWVLLAPYGWIAGMNGQVGVGGRTVDIDITPGEVLSHLGSVDGALMLHSEVGRGDWGFILDANLIRAGTSVTTVPAQVDVTLQQTMIEALGMYRLVNLSDYLVEGKSLSVDLLAGGRFYEFSNILTVRPFDPLLPTVPLNLSASWVDMVLGGRTVIPVTNSLDVFGRADIGGFGIGSSSTLAWNLIAGVDWKMTSCSSLIAGYRELNINKSGGVGGTAFDFNAKMYGPFMAVSFQF
ncbi:hypothetical protein [Schlesneria paludicola]|uniref:hypothetical protein n=1 Tax=Schlesneria paludicola TaxID=360056 RepID=UPI000299D43B|nr:hypothetical protein [Schlesneria paludicola]